MCHLRIEIWQVRREKNETPKMQKDKADIISTTKAFWSRKAGVTLSDEEAREAVENLTGFFQLLGKWHRTDCNPNSKNASHSTHSLTRASDSSASLGH